MSLPRGAVGWSAMWLVKPTCLCQKTELNKHIWHKGENCLSVYTFQKNASCVSFGMWFGGGAKYRRCEGEFITVT